jgi:cobalt-zinc-cadmium resistance protein CzcA
VYNLAQCIDIALKNNENLKTAYLNIEHEKQNKKNVSEISKTTIVYTQGQFNSIYKYDENITISQAIPFPTQISSKNAVVKAQIKSSEFRMESTKPDLIFQVRTAYYSLIYSKAVQRLLHTEDSIYKDFAATVEKKYSENKATLLEKTAAETQVMEVENQLLESEEDINSYHIQLLTLMNVQGDFDIENLDLSKNYLVAPVDTLLVLDHPLLKHLKQQVEVNRRYISVEKARILPDLSVSYFNQTIYGPANIFGQDYFLTKRNRLQGFAVGLAVPLWFLPQKSRIEAARINTRQAQSDYDYHSSVMQGHYSQAVRLYLKYRKSLNFYQSNALTNSRRIIEEASKSYNKAEISYVDYLQIVGHALNIESNYLGVIHQNNMAVLKIEYFQTR